MYYEIPEFCTDDTTETCVLITDDTNDNYCLSSFIFNSNCALKDVHVLVVIYISFNGINTIVGIIVYWTEYDVEIKFLT